MNDHNMIDTAFYCADNISTIKAAGISMVGRYYNHTNSLSLPSKCLTQVTQVSNEWLLVDTGGTGYVDRQYLQPMKVNKIDVE